MKGFAMSLDEPTTRDIVRNIGRARMQAVLDVGPSFISKILRENCMPPGWYEGVRRMCDEVGCACPLELFTFREFDLDRGREAETKSKETE